MQSKKVSLSTVNRVKTSNHLKLVPYRTSYVSGSAFTHSSVQCGIVKEYINQDR